MSHKTINSILLWNISCKLCPAYQFLSVIVTVQKQLVLFPNKPLFIKNRIYFKQKCSVLKAILGKSKGWRPEGTKGRGGAGRAQAPRGSPAALPGGRWPHWPCSRTWCSRRARAGPGLWTAWRRTVWARFWAAPQPPPHTFGCRRGWFPGSVRHRVGGVGAEAEISGVTEPLDKQFHRPASLVRKSQGTVCSHLTHTKKRYLSGKTPRHSSKVITHRLICSFSISFLFRLQLLGFSAIYF